MSLATISSRQDKTRQDKTISVIVPVYKAEKYLSKCLESIIN